MPAKNSKADPGELDAYSVPEFCRRHQISVGHFYNMQRDGIAPQTMLVGEKRTLISKEAAARWRKDRERVAAGKDDAKA